MRVNRVLVAGAMLLAMSAVPLELLASTADEFGGQEFIDQSNKIQGFLFGPMMRIAGVMGGAYGLIQSILTSTIKPLIAYGAIGMGVNLIPKFIDGVFSVSGMLISGM